MTSDSVLPEPPTASPAAEGSGPLDERQRAKGRVGLTIKNKWRLDALLGVGGMASVYAVTHTRNGSRAALKILHAEFARDAGIRERFLREGYVANQIDHPGRVAILDDDATEQNEPYLVMELLEGETVQQLWKRNNRKLAVADALWIASEVLETLEVFHRRGIVHRDLKPANIFITRDNLIKLLDFGVARVLGGMANAGQTRAGTALGTPSFMAPEQAMGLPDQIDGRADVFSVGATLYALLSGQRLHQGRSDTEAFILAATTPAPSLARLAPELPSAVISLVDKALAWDKKNRFTSAGQMQQEVLRLLDDMGANVPQRPEPPSSRRPMPEPVPPSRTGRARTGPAVEQEPPDEEKEENATDDDPAVMRLVEVFRRFEKLLPTVRHYGWEHPEADNKLRATFQSVVAALVEDSNAFYWKLTPYAFEHRGCSIWEPSAPLDGIPYHLFAAGVRRIQLLSGLTEEEFRSLTEVMLMDPTRDLLPEDDVAAALWERRLEHVRYDIVSVFAEGDASDREQFWSEADDLEDMARKAAEERANRAEAAAMIIDTDRQAMAAAKRAASVLALEPAVQRALGNQLILSPERWSERFIDVIAYALLNAKRYGDVQLVSGPLDASARDLILARRFDVLFGMVDAIQKSLESLAAKAELASISAEFVRGMFPSETLRLLLREAVRQPSTSAQAAPVDMEFMVENTGRLLHKLGPGHLLAVMDMVGRVDHVGFRKALFSYIERMLPGHEASVVDTVMTLDIDVARPILQIFSTLRTQGSLDALRRLSGCGSAILRCEAIAYLAASPEQAKEELLQMTETGQPDQRMAALRTLAHHQIRAAGPLLVRRMQDNSFQELGIDERREMLRALYALNPTRGEAIAIELLQRHGFLTDDALEQTRVLSAELLGQEARTQEALDAVLAATKRRLWNSQALRDAAIAAAQKIGERLNKRVAPSGDVQ